MIRCKKTVAVLAMIFAPMVASASDGDIETRGSIEALSDTSVTVSSVTYALNSFTEYEDHNDNSISLSAFALGDFVEVKGLNVGGVLVAREVEFESDVDEPDGDNNNDDGQKNDGSSSSSSGDDDLGDDNRRESGRRHGSKSKLSNDNRVRVRGKFSDATGIVTAAHGKSDYRLKGDDERFKVNIDVPIPSSLPNVPDEAGAAALNLLVILTRAGATYATCTPVFSGVEEQDEDEGSVLEADYKVDVRNKDGDLRLKKGTCDTDMATPDTQLGVPAVQDGDVVSVQNVADATIFLNATLHRKN